MPYKVAIKDNVTGEVRIHEDSMEWEEHSEFMWTEGNFGCDCNRHLFFERANGINPDNADVECGECKYSVLYVELPGGEKLDIEDL